MEQCFVCFEGTNYDPFECQLPGQILWKDDSGTEWIFCPFCLKIVHIDCFGLTDRVYKLIKTKHFLDNFTKWFDCPNDECPQFSSRLRTVTV